jgi:hypothetical protein
MALKSDGESFVFEFLQMLRYSSMLRVRAIFTRFFERLNLHEFCPFSKQVSKYCRKFASFEQSFDHKPYFSIYF